MVITRHSERRGQDESHPIHSVTSYSWGNALAGAEIHPNGRHDQEDTHDCGHRRGLHLASESVWPTARPQCYQGRQVIV